MSTRTYDSGSTDVPLGSVFDSAQGSIVLRPLDSEYRLLDQVILKYSNATGPSITTATGDSLHVRIATKLTDIYPLITVDNEIFGEPRLSKHRFGVSDVLSSLCIHNSFEAVIEKHGNRYTEEELKDAVRFARDFLNAFYASDEDDS